MIDQKPEKAQEQLVFLWTPLVQSRVSVLGPRSGPNLGTSFGSCIVLYGFETKGAKSENQNRFTHSEHCLEKKWNQTQTKTGQTVLRMGRLFGQHWVQHGRSCVHQYG